MKLFKKVKYLYLIDYRFNKINYLTVNYGTMILKLPRKIKTEQDIADINKFIEEYLGDDCSNVAMNNFVYIGKE